MAKKQWGYQADQGAPSSPTNTLTEKKDEQIEVSNVLLWKTMKVVIHCQTETLSTTTTLNFLTG